MKTITGEFDFTVIDGIIIHNLDDDLEPQDQAEISDKKIIDRLLKYLSKSRKCLGKFFPSIKMDLLKNGKTIYEIYVSDNYLNINGMVLRSSKNIGKIIKKAFFKSNYESNPSN